MLASTLVTQKRTNLQYLLKVAQSVKFLARQGIPLRGDGNERDSNFMQLLYLRGADDPQFLTGLQQRSDRYTSPQIQNELIKTMEIVTFVQDAKFFSLMADEVTDVAKKRDNLDLTACLNEFVSGNEHRLSVFGKF